MTSVLIANPIVAPFHAKAPGGRKHRQNAAMLAIDIAAFGDVDGFAHPHSFLRLASGNVLATFQMRHATGSTRASACRADSG